MSRESSLVPTNLLNWPRVESLLPDQRLILIWLWASPCLNSAGCGTVYIKPSAATLGLDPAALRGGLQTLQDAGLVDIDQDTGELFVCDWFRFHKFRSPIQSRNLESDIKKIDSPRLKRLILEKSTTYKTTATATSTSTSTVTNTNTLKPLQAADRVLLSSKKVVVGEPAAETEVSGSGTPETPAFELKPQPAAKPVKKASVIVNETDAFPEILDRSLISDWFALRKSKRAPVTMTVIEGFKREVAKLGWTEEQGLRKWCERSWVGFEAAWVQKELKGASGSMPGRHINLGSKDYRKGVSADGRLLLPV